jgi:hypothetical protein
MTLYVAPGGNDANDGKTVATALATLAGAQARVTNLATMDYVIIVKGGEYRGQTVDWNKVASDARIHIKAADGETPVFDGFAPNETKSRLRYFLNLTPDVDLAKTNVTIEGLTIKHYIQSGIVLRGQCARLYNNKLLENGDSFGDCTASPAPGTSHYVINGPGTDCAGNQGMCCPTRAPDSDCWCTGFGAIDMPAAQHNLIKHNDIVGFQANHFNADLLHFVYLSRSGSADNPGPSSMYNVIEDNYGSYCDGSGIKVRAGSDHNVFRNNYLERLNKYCFGRQDTEVHESLTGNVCTFQQKTAALDPFSGDASTTLTATSPTFYLGTISGTHPNETGTPDTYQSTNRYMQTVNDPVNGTSTLDEVVTASTAADLNGDGKPEVFVALYYPTLHYSKVVYSDGGNNNLRTVAYTNTEWKITAMTAIRPANGAPVEIAAAFYLGLNDMTQIWVGKRAADGRYNLNGGTKLYEGTGASAWKVSAMTAGRFGMDFEDVLVTAAVSNGVQEIWRGDGHSAQSGASQAGVAITKIYSSANWRVPAMTNGVISGGVNSLIVAYHWVASSTALNRIYTADGVAGANSVQILPDTTKQITAMTVGKLGGSTPRLVTAFDTGSAGQVYPWTGTTIAASPIYSNGSWRVTSLATAQVDAAANDQLVTSLDLSTRTLVTWGDGTTGVTNGGTLYSFP